MELVFDANVLVAGFLRSAVTRELLLDERLTLWTPEYVLSETEHVLTSRRLRSRLGRLSPSEIRFVLNQLTAKVRILPVSTYQHKLHEAKRLAPHAEDASYLALALHLHLPLWSNDSALKNQRIVPVHTTQEQHQWNP
jgi:predicted nucleic acid-binding protein